ncbi:hypothetical protein [Flavobacterium sp. LM4]|uniref:hypothetical protein n=1 Tax=Flavobacterium sp. LM4 TaxID=1938609 RepID=UPI000992248B|nr:hypothetical protein [Flavobacterium sp. LM4]OOV17660.1 hypothetical protein BXU10_16485 [Flavobacterium sp. LM4]
MEERKKWLDAVEKFRIDINTIVICPHCEKGNLIVNDVAFDESEINKGGERFIECLTCGKFEIVLYRRPPENWYSKNNTNGLS